jgi:hypothetical protein
MSWLKHYTKAQADLTARLAPETEPAPPPKPQGEPEMSTYPELERLIAARKAADRRWYETYGDGVPVPDRGDYFDAWNDYYKHKESLK